MHLIYYRYHTKVCRSFYFLSIAKTSEKEKKRRASNSTFRARFLPLFRIFSTCQKLVAGQRDGNYVLATSVIHCDWPGQRMRRPRVLSFQLPSRPLFFSSFLGLICARHEPRACQQNEGKMAMRMNSSLSYVESGILRFTFLRCDGQHLAPNLRVCYTQIFYTFEQFPINSIARDCRCVAKRQNLDSRFSI